MRVVDLWAVTQTLILMTSCSVQLIADYVTPPQKELCRDLDAKIKPNIR